MNNDKMKAAFAEEELIKISGGTTEDFDPESALKTDEEWMNQNGIHIFGDSSVRFG